MKITEMMLEVKDAETMKSWVPHLDKAFEFVKTHDIQLYEEIEDYVEWTAYGEKLSEHKAEKLVKEMRPYGEHWSFEEIKEMFYSYSISASHESVYFIMNMAYNDYYNLFENDHTKYMEFTRLWVDDIDSNTSADTKTYRYATMV